MPNQVVVVVYPAQCPACRHVLDLVLTTTRQDAVTGNVEYVCGGWWWQVPHPRRAWIYEAHPSSFMSSGRIGPSLARRLPPPAIKHASPLFLPPTVRVRKRQKSKRAGSRGCEAGRFKSVTGRASKKATLGHLSKNSKLRKAVSETRRG